METHHVLRDQQHGFHHHRSRETQLITTIHDFAQCLNQGGQCDVVLLDFCKAFNKVPHPRLFYKLHHYGIRGTILTWITNFLTDSSQQVILDNRKSKSCSVLSGVPQGTVLAPLLFLIYINDLPLHVSNRARLYADDVILYSYIHSLDDCHNLQKDFDNLTECRGGSRILGRGSEHRGRSLKQGVWGAPRSYRVFPFYSTEIMPKCKI